MVGKLKKSMFLRGEIGGDVQKSNHGKWSFEIDIEMVKIWKCFVGTLPIIISISRARTGTEYLIERLYWNLLNVNSWTRNQTLDNKNLIVYI